MNSTYADVIGISMDKAREVVAFDFSREDLVSEDNRVHANRDLLVRTDSNSPLGIIPKNRPLIPYGEVMDWVCDEFDHSGFDFKLRDSAITAKGDLYQEYLFDMKVDSPDSSEISPLAIVKSSYSGVPLEILMGTYRFVCRNGIVAGETIGHLKVSARNGGEFLQSSIRDDLAVKFDKFQRVGDKYKDLEAQSFTPVLLDFLSSEIIPMLMKKNVMYMMQEDGNISLTVDKLKSENLQGAIDELYNIVKEQSSWYLYNVATQYATHNARSANARLKHYGAISEFFGV